MMDAQTLHAYESSAAVRCQHYRLILPTELLQFAQAFFHPGQLTADLGCGSGRDVDWLNRHGFPAIGYDASPAMLAEARAAYSAAYAKLKDNNPLHGVVEMKLDSLGGPAK